MEHQRRSTDKPQDTSETQTTGGLDHDYGILNSPEMRANYITLTDNLISKFAREKTDVAIFLDKSARPVAWLVMELWDSLAPRDKETGQVIKRPDIKFLNIDREQWGAIIGRSEVEVGGINVDRLPAERLAELRGLYAPVPTVSNPGDVSLLSDKKVMVIDEVRMSGDTLYMAERILSRAFPDAQSIEGTYWMDGAVKVESRSSVMLRGEVPIWYSDETVKGRLVADRDTTKSLASNSSRVRLGRFWVSTLFREPDESGRQLKAEVKQLAADLAEHRIPYMPSPGWDESLESLDSRIERIDGIGVSEYANLLRKAGSKANFVDLYSQYIKSHAAA